MSKRLKFSALLVSLLLFLVPVMPASAASMSVKIIKFGNSNFVTDRAVTFSIEYSGGPADTANSCADLMKTLGYDFTFDFTVDGQTESEPTSYFDVKDAALSATSIRCDYSTNMGFGAFQDTDESKPISMSVSWKSSPIISVSGTLLNPNFPGSITITNPTRGAEIRGFTTVSYSGNGGQNRTMQDLQVYVCSIKCEYGTIPMQVIPRVRVGQTNGDYMDGYAAISDDGTLKVYFKKTGINEIRLRAHYGEVGAVSSVFVNVVSTINDTQIPWQDALDMMQYSSDRVGFAANMDCVNSNLSLGVNRTCTVSVGPYPSYSYDSLKTQVPVTFSTSTNGGSFKVVKKMTLSTNTPTKVSIPVPKTLKTFTIRMSIDDYVDDGNYYSRNGVSDSSWGPPPTSIQMSVNPTVFWGQQFKISISSNKKASGSCRVLQSNISTISSFKISNGRGSGTAKVVWGGGVGSRITIPLFAYCTIGGVNAMAYSYTTGVR